MSVSVPSDLSLARRWRSSSWPVATIATAFFVAHLPSLAPSLEDIDSINFALGLHEFDPARHQPHPPGYPVYIALGRISSSAFAALLPAWEATRVDALALAIWSAIGGAAALVAAWYLFRGIERAAGRAPGVSRLDSPTSAARGSGAVRADSAAAEAAGSTWPSTWAAGLLALAPLFWLSALRPMSDMPGLAMALGAQALVVHGIWRPRLVVAGACLAGLAAGIRVQSLALTVPLLVVVVVFQARRFTRLEPLRRQGARLPLAPLRVALSAAVALTLGVLVWAAPLLAATGGLDGYVRALGSQAGEDFAWVDMLWSNPTPRRLALSLYETFALPWASSGLAIAIAVAACLGWVVMLVRARRALGLLGVAFLPYAIFHLLLQETATVRYALPLLPPVAWLAARGIAATGRLAAPLWLAFVVAAASEAVPAGVDYGSEAHPAFRAIANMRLDADGVPPAAVYAHYALYRPLQAMAPGAVRVVPPVRNLEWLGPETYWRDGGTQSIWFLADPRRTDLALIDPTSVRRDAPYTWKVAGRPELRGSRPLGVDWFRIAMPGWFVGEGWSLTPETGGFARASGKGLDRQPIEGYVRRRPEAVSIMVGGFHLGPPDDSATEISLTLDDRVVDRWTFDHREAGPSFVRFLPLPGGVPAGAGNYARLRVSARAVVPGRPTPEIAIRQFDVQSLARPVMGFAEGWHEAEANPATGLSWRWTSERSVLRIASPAVSLSLILRGESPLKYFDAPPTVRITAGEMLLAEYRPTGDFEWRISVPAAALARSGGTIVITTDKVYLPGQAEGTADARRLGLRVFACEITVDRSGSSP